MNIQINDKSVTVAAGMTVRHALIAAGYTLPKANEKVRDEWGNEVGLDGALQEGMKLTLGSENNAAH